jgi:hypothetical protein
MAATLELLVSDGECGHRHPEGLEHDSLRVDGVHLLGVDGRHARTEIALRLDQAFFLEHPQHFPHRPAADPESLRELHLVELGPRGDLVGDDLLAKTPMDLGHGVAGDKA